MIETALALEGTAAGLSLLDNLIHLIRTARERNEPFAASDIILRLPAEAHAIAGRIITRVETLRMSFINAKIDTSRTIRDLENDKGFWFEKKYRLIQGFNSEMQGLTDASGHLLEDFVSIANCKGADESVAAAFAKPRKRQEQLESLIRRDVSVQAMFDGLLGHAKSIREELGTL